MRMTILELMSKDDTSLGSFRNIFELLGHLKVCAARSPDDKSNDPKAEF